ncbi:MAG TPA: cbb3-type cytochrome c oxidase subunit I [Rhodospirillales bacterium]|jgi:hypothetical protein|nr:cbb3-type cytochrome c oxidase subunit I [Rhodospirillales bacterium]
MSEIPPSPSQPSAFAFYGEMDGAPLSRHLQCEIREWSVLAIGALAVAGVFAFFLALSRIPGIQDLFPWPLEFFHKGLVIHVVFSLVVWFLAVFGGSLSLSVHRVSAGTPRFNGLGHLARLGVALSFAFLSLPALLDRGDPVLNNYVPVIIDPLYYLGLIFLGGGVMLAVTRLLLNLACRRQPLDLMAFIMACAAVIYLLVLVCLALALWQLRNEELSHAFNEVLFWGGGHVMQFVNLALLLAAWYLLAGRGLGKPVGGTGLFAVAVALLVIFALPAPVFYFVFDSFSVAQAKAFTDLQYAFAPPALIAATAIVTAIARHRREAGTLPWENPAFLCLVLSVVVFGVGGFMGLFVDGADTRTTAHYHGVIAGINLAFMGLFFCLFLPLQNRPVNRGKALYAQIYLFGTGQLMAVAGLFLAGHFGTPRKTAGAAQGLEEIGAKIGMYLNGIGALIAVIGGVMFIYTVAAALLRKPPAAAQENL